MVLMKGKLMAEKIQNNPFNRPPRIQSSFSSFEVDLPSPPSTPDETKQNILSVLLPISSFLVMGLFYSVMFSGSSSNGGWIYAIMMLALGGTTALTTYIVVETQKHEQKQKWIKSLIDYHRMLDRREARIFASRLLELNYLESRFLSPNQLIDRINRLEITLWEKRQQDIDFLQLRLGIGNIKSSVRIKCPDPDIANPEVRRTFSIRSKNEKIYNAPVTIDLREIGSVAIVGARNQTLSLSRSIILQLSINNSPEDLDVYLFSTESGYKSWQWLRWLPHTNSNHLGGEPEFLAFTRLMSKKIFLEFSKNIDFDKKTSIDEVTQQSSAKILFIDNNVEVREDPNFPILVKEGKGRNIYTVFICSSLEDVPSDCQSIIKVANDKFVFSQVGVENNEAIGAIDSVSLTEIDDVAHKLLPISIKTLGQNSRIPSGVNLLQTYQINSVSDLDILKKWGRLPNKDGLLPFPVKLGNETFATPFSIHLAENLDGPHGIIAGTTGSGKSELLQTLVIALAIEHNPYFVNFLLIDFKGGSTFSTLKDLPHVVGMVSNLDKLTASRALEAIRTEVLRREKFLISHKFENINSYHSKLFEYSELSPDWEPLPHLFIIVDEFAQMAQEMPEFLPQIVSLGQVGRSLGIHLILATQRPAGVITDSVRSNINFRICLRVQSIEDSRDMLLRPIAASLPHNLPGRAYFQLGDTGSPRMFQVARSAVESLGHHVPIDHLYKIEYEQPIELLQESQKRKLETTILSEIVKEIHHNFDEHFIKHGFSQPSPILLDPLPEQIKLTSLLENEKCSWQKSNLKWKENSDSKITIPIGVIDSLTTKTQPTKWIDFTEFGGHVLFVGGPQSGKTYSLLSVVQSLVNNYSPSEVNIYALSFASRELEIFKNFPHVGAVIQGSESERFQRFLRFLKLQIEIRKNKFGELQAQDIVDYNKNCQETDRLPRLCILIDNFGELKNPEYVDELADIEKVIQTGRIYGMHFVITALQANDVPYRIENLIQQRFALNLGDHSEYLNLVGRPNLSDFENLPQGRCFISGANPPLHCQIGLPFSPEQWQSLEREMKAIWKNKQVPKEIGTLETLVYLSDIVSNKESFMEKTRLPIGVDGDSLEEYFWELSTETPHLLIGGSSQSGRTNLLNSLVLSLANHYSPEEIKIILVDGSGRSLSKVKDFPHIVDWVTDEDRLTSNIANMESELEYRRKHIGKDYSPIVFVIDDYDQLTEAIAIGEEILLKLGRHIRQDSDLNFHFLISVSSEFPLTSDPLLKQIKLMKTGISLGNTDTLENLGGQVSQAMRNQPFIQGRGYALTRTGSHLVQFGIADPLSYDNVRNKWIGEKRSKWDHLASEEALQQVREESAPVLKRDSSRTIIANSPLIDQEASLRMYLEQQRNKGSK